MSQGEISSGQMAILIFASIAPSSILLVPALTSQDAGRDLWLSALWSSFSGLLLIFILIRLHRLYPKQTIVEYAQTIFGSILGKFVTVIFLFHLFFVNSLILRGYGEFIAGTFLPHVPLTVIMGGMTFLCAMAVRGGGLEVLGRLAQLILPLIFIIWIILIILSIPDWDPSNILPVMDDGILPSLTGGIRTLVWFGNFSLIAFMLPFVGDQKNIMRYNIYAWIAVTLTMIITSLVALFIFGETVYNLSYPFMEVVRYIMIGNFIEHIDALLIIIWVTGTFIQIALFHYTVVMGTSQWLELTEYTFLSLPLGILLVIFASWAAPNLQELMHFITNTHVYYSIFCRYVIPIILLAAGMVKLKFTDSDF